MCESFDINPDEDGSRVHIQCNLAQEHSEIKCKREVREIRGNKRAQHLRRLWSVSTRFSDYQRWPVRSLFGSPEYGMQLLTRALASKDWDKKVEPTDGKEPKKKELLVKDVVIGYMKHPIYRPFLEALFEQGLGYLPSAEDERSISIEGAGLFGELFITSISICLKV